MKKKALFSLYLFDKVNEFARDLINLGWEIIATSETSRILIQNELPVIDIVDFTGVKENFGFPPTLHPKIEACLTMPQEERIDLVYVIPYPLFIGNDVGGRTLLALAAKGNRVPVMSVSDMELVVGELRSNGRISQELRQSLIDKTNVSIASHYDDLIKERKDYDLIVGDFQYELLNGENPYQVPAQLFSVKENNPLSIYRFKQLSGGLPCFTNMADADSILHTISLAAEAFNLRYKKSPYICIAAKHGNACGMAVSWDDPEEAVNKALFGNPRSIWGGELIVNFNIDAHLAHALLKSRQREVLLGDPNWMLDMILAPGFSPEAVDILGKRKGRKIFANDALLSISLTPSRHSYRFVRGGFLRQPPNNYILDFTNVEMVGDVLNESMVDSLIIAWAVAWSSNHGGNEISIVKASQLVGAGGGPSTIEAATTAVARAKSCHHHTGGSVFAADAFFPFPDAPRLLAKSGVKAGLVPAGGKGFDQIKTFFREKGLTVLYLSEQYRGFCRH